MNFNSGKNWLNAAKLGAKAVIFIEPSETNRFESESKFLKTPVYFPRLYVTGENGKEALEVGLAILKSGEIGSAVEIES